MHVIVGKGSKTGSCCCMRHIKYMSMSQRIICKRNRIVCIQEMLAKIGFPPEIVDAIILMENAPTTKRIQQRQLRLYLAVLRFDFSDERIGRESSDGYSNHVNVRQLRFGPQEVIGDGYSDRL